MISMCCVQKKKKQKKKNINFIVKAYVKCKVSK